MLPKNLKLGRSYSNAVDLWALGVVVHEILTSEIPFLDRDRDTNMTMSDQFTNSDDTPEVDMELLFKYCRDPTLFPIEPLHTNGMGDVWQDFVRSLMAVDPRDRPSAPDALNSRCCTENDLEKLRNQLGVLLSVELHPAVITVLLGSELGVFIAVLHSFAGTTILELHRKATEMGFLEVVWFVERTAYETYCGGDLSSLQLPYWYGQIDMMNVIRDCGAFIDVPYGDSLSETIMQKSAADGYLDVVKLLIAQGADVNAGSRSSGEPTALGAAARKGHVDVVKLLIAHGADVNAGSQSYGGLTALQAAAEHGQVDAIKVLLSHGAYADAIYWGRAALHIAAKNGQVDALKVLLAHGADVNANHGGWTALHDAAEKGHVDAIKILLAYGADFDEEDSAGLGFPVSGSFPLQRVIYPTGNGWQGSES